MREHLTYEEIDLLIYEPTLVRAESEIEAHVEACVECSGRVAGARRLRQALSRMPLDPAPPNLAQRVLSDLGIQEAPSLVWIFFKNFSPIVALTIVAISAYALLSSSGAFQNKSTMYSLQELSDSYGVLRDEAARWLTPLEAWLGESVSFLGRDGRLAVFVVLFFGAVALIDRYLLMPLFRKRTSARTWLLGGGSD